MEQYAKLLTSIAALIGAIAWPATLVAVVCVFRNELKSALNKIPVLLDRATKVSLAGVALELDRVANAELAGGADKSGKITPLQIQAATRIAAQTRDVSSHALLNELDKLCLEYDSLRRTMPPGGDRTRAMTAVVVKMRALAPTLVDFVETYKGSGSPGSRLAAIAMMQMVPRTADITWLKDRFFFEKPFLFYHAALALQNVANIAETAEEKQRLRAVAQEALATIKNFDGPPDQNTIQVLESLISSLPQQ